MIWEVLSLGALRVRILDMVVSLKTSGRVRLREEFSKVIKVRRLNTIQCSGFSLLHLSNCQSASDNIYQRNNYIISLICQIVNHKQL